MIVATWSLFALGFLQLGVLVAIWLTLRAQTQKMQSATTNVATTGRKIGYVPGEHVKCDECHSIVARHFHKDGKTICANCDPAGFSESIKHA